MVGAVAELHKNNRLFRLLLEQIKSGKLAAGDRLPPERKLAELYLCSRVTVRNSLEQLENQNYIYRRQGSGTYVSDHKSLADKELKTIAVILNTDKEDISNDPYLSQVLMGLQETCSNFSCNFNIIKLRQGEKFAEVLALKKIPLWRFDGYLLLGDVFDDNEIDLLQELKIPFTSFVLPHSAKSFSCVVIDNCSGAYIAASHLLSLKRRNIVLLNGCRDEELSLLKQKGFRRALEEYGLNFSADMELFAIPNEDKTAYQEVTAILRCGETTRPDALLVYGDWATYGAIKAIRDNGLRVPEDIAVVMIDDFSWVSRVLELPITAVRQPFQEQAGRALSLLLRQMENKGNNVNTVEILQPQLMVRKSCGVAL